MRVGLLALLIGLLLSPDYLLANPRASAAADNIPAGALYRYRAADGQLKISSILPHEALAQGYEVIDGSGRVLRTVEPAIPEEERARLLAEKQQREEIERLRKLFPYAEDAERARDRQIASIELNIGYARGLIVQLDAKLANEVALAARAEQAGRPVSEGVQANIDVYTRQIREQEERIERLNADIEEVRSSFEPIILQLRQAR